MTSNKVALVTGASRGIGRACALGMARRGFDIVVTARTVEEGKPVEGDPALSGSTEATARDIEALGQRALTARMDMLDRPSMDAAVKAAMDEFGRIDVLVNNAVYTGGRAHAPFLETPMDVLDLQFETNVMGHLYMTKLIAPIMAERGGGCIVGISSGSGSNEMRAQPGQGAPGLGYGMTKAAFNRMASGLAKELKAHGISVFNLEPGHVTTERGELEWAKAGFDAHFGLSMDVPGEACGYLVSHPRPMVFSGRTIDAVQILLDTGLHTGAGFPPAYGEPVWGLPLRPEEVVSFRG